MEAARIKEGAEYEGVRIKFNAILARARIPMQIDIGFGDVIVPAPTEVKYPTLLDFPAPVLLAYPKETVVAEKLEALTKLGLLYKLELPTSTGLSQWHSAIFAAVRPAPQRPAFCSGRFAKGHSLISSGLSFLNSSTRDTGVNPFRVRAA